MKKLTLLLSVFIFLVNFTFAQPKDLRTIREDKQSDGYVGVALLIGNSAYQYATQLNSPVNDANDMGKVLTNLGFKVLKVRANARLDEMETAIAEFERELSANKGVGVFYYSGHGVQSKGLNYLIPVDANIPTEAFLRSKAVDLESVMGTMETATKKAKIVILDACRNDPFKGWANKGSSEKGLAKVDAPDGMLIAFATSPKKTAADGLGRNSPYTEILLQEIAKPNISITDMLQNVRSNLAEKYEQISWENTSLLGRFCFAGCNIQNSIATENPSNENSNKKETEKKNPKPKTTPNPVFTNSQNNTLPSTPLLNNNEAQSVANKALSEVLIGNDEKAKNLAEEALQKNGNLALALAVRGWAKFEINNGGGGGGYIWSVIEPSKIDLEKALKLEPKNMFFSAILMRIYSYGSNYKGADKNAKKIISQMTSPNTFLDYYARGLAFLYQRKFDEAKNDFTKSIELNPNFPHAYFARWKVYFISLNSRKELEKADLIAAARINPEFRNADGGEYSLSRSSAYYKIAEEYVEKAKKLNEVNKFEEAIQEYNNAINFHPNILPYYYERGLLFYQISNFDSAILDFDIVLKDAPYSFWGTANLSRVYFSRAATFYRKGNYDKAIDDYSEFINLRKDDSNGFNNRGLCYLQKKQYDLAIRDFNKAIEINPNDPVHYKNRAIVYEALGKTDLAETDRKMAEEMKNKKP